MWFKQYLIFAFRNIFRNKFSSFINIGSLVVGFSCLILITIWINYELSYDNFHANTDRTYRITYNGYLQGKRIKDCTTSRVLKDALINDFAEVETATSVFNFDEALLAKDNGESFMLKLSAVSPEFFQVFNVPIIKGDINELNKPKTAFLTRESAKRIFGDSDPIGQAISTGMDGEYKRFTVAGIVEKLPQNSHLSFDMLYSNPTMRFLYNSERENWLEAVYHNYVVLKPNVDYKEFEKKFNYYTTNKIAPIIQRWLNLSLDQWHDQGEYIKFEPQPLKRIHLTPGFEGSYKPSGNILYVYIFLIVGILILLISIINFSNLSTVKSLSRYKDIGIRKVSGSSRKKIIIQILFESCILTSIALIVSIFIITTISPIFKTFTQINISIINFSLPLIFISGILLIVFSGVMGGAFPAFYLSGLKPLKVLGANRLKLKGVLFKDALIVFQFVISVLVIVGAFVISQQLDFLQNKSLGFKKDNILVIKGTENLSKEKNVLLNKELMKIGSVKSSSSSQQILNENCSYYIFSHAINQQVKLLTLDVVPCDYNFKNVYQFELLEGQFFKDNFSAEHRKTVINETAAKLLSVDNCIGQIIQRGDTKYEVIGVVKDFHYSSKQAQIPPMVMVELPDTEKWWSPIYCSILMQGNNVNKTINEVKHVWNRIAPGNELSYSFFDQDYNALYKQESQTKTVFIWFAFIAISLSCFGLFGFVKYLVQNRTKEIGIRKVNGAKAESIFVLLSKYFTKPIIVAMVIGFPLSYIGLNKWLMNFTYQVKINVTVFVWSGLLLLVVVFLTVGWLGFIASRKNPVEALRSE